MFFGLELLSLSHFSHLPLAVQIKSEAQLQNQILFEELFNRFANIAITRYEWEGLPKTVSERFLNTSLFCIGNSAFFNDRELGFMTLPCVTNGKYNAYYEPLEVRAYSFNIEKRLTNTENKPEFVFMRNNPTCTPTAFTVYEYTRRMADVLRTIDVLGKKMKQPFIFTCEEKQRLTYVNAIKKVVDNETLILGTKDFGVAKDKLDLFDMRLSPDFAALWDNYKNLESILYTALGINNVSTEKRERLITDEVNANNMVTNMSIEVNLKELQFACMEVNKRYGLEIWVKAKELGDYRREAEGYGAIYNGTPQVN